MPRTKRTDDWGWPRWRGYGSNSDAQAIKLCDRYGCDRPGDCPAPKSPSSPDRWYFCADHAAEYNRSWDYFEGLSAEDAAARAAEESRGARSYARAQHYEWSGPGDGTRSGDEMRALDILGLDPDVDFESIKKAWRALAKETHPDVKPGDADAAKRFQAGQVAFEVLRQADDRKSWKPA